jgi:hypothetical protein
MAQVKATMAAKSPRIAVQEALLLMLLSAEDALPLSAPAKIACSLSF